MPSYFYKEDFTKEDDFFTPMFTAEDVQVTEFSDLLTSFADKFKGVDHTGEFRENIFLIAQTESFVTYGIEVFTMGCSGNSSLYLQTFSKADGHRIHNIINPKDVARFDPYEDLYSTECGLLYDGIIVDGRQGPDYETGYGILSYDDVMPYLSQETQDLVKNMGEISKWKDCFIGERLATIKTNGNKTIELTVRPAKHDWYWMEGDLWYDEYGLNNNSTYGGQDLMAIYVEKDGYELAPVIDGDSIITGHWDCLYSTKPDISSGGWEHENYSSFAFDTVSNALYVPCTEHMHMGYHECNDRYSVYRFNNFDGFVYEGEDGGFWLHPSLRQYGRLCFAGKTKNYLIRIDEMRIYDDRYDEQREAEKNDAHRYRFAAWKGEYESFIFGNDLEKMINEPDIVIYNGHYNLGHVSSYVFSDNGYDYVVKLTHDDTWDGRTTGFLEVYQDEKLIDKQDLEENIVKRSIGLVRKDSYKRK